jgi:hypothetical protein
MRKVGNEGVITVEEAKSLETELEVVEGMQFDRGYISPYFITNADKMVAELEDPYILIYEKQLSSLQALLPFLESIVQVGAPPGRHCGGRARRSARHPGGEQAARWAQGGGHQSAKLRRSPQGNARRHRHPDRRAGPAHGARWLPLPNCYSAARRKPPAGG